MSHTYVRQIFIIGKVETSDLRRESQVDTCELQDRLRALTSGSIA